MRTIVFRHDHDLLPVLFDVRSMVRHLVNVALDRHIASAITLRKETADWFSRSWRSRYGAHYHHSACSMAVGVCRSYWRLQRQRKRVHLPEPSPPRPRRLFLRLDQELFRIKEDVLDVTVRPGVHLSLPLTDARKHRRWEEWSKAKLGELTLTPRSAGLAFQVAEPTRVKAQESVGIDLNLRHADGLATDGKVVHVDLSALARIQKDGQKRRERVQKALPTNLRKQREVLRACGRRQAHRTREQIRKVAAPAIVEAAGGRNIIFEDLSAKEGMVVDGPSRDLRRKLSGWTTGLLQRETEQRSPAVVARVNPRGTSSECLSCGGNVVHPTWRTSRCGTCGDFDRDLMASGIIMERGRGLLGVPPLDATARASLVELCRSAPGASVGATVNPDAGNGLRG